MFPGREIRSYCGREKGKRGQSMDLFSEHRTQLINSQGRKKTKVACSIWVKCKLRGAWEEEGEGEGGSTEKQQFLKYLSCKPEDLSSSSRTYSKMPGFVAHVYNLSAGEVH